MLKNLILNLIKLGRNYTMGKFRTDVHLSHQFLTGVNTSYTPSGTNAGDTGLYEHDTADYAQDSIQVFFEVTLLVTEVGPSPIGAESCRVQLFEKGGSAITGSEVSHGNPGTQTRLRSGDISANLSGAQELFVQTRTTHTSYQYTVTDPRLITIQNGNVTKTVIAWTIGDDNSAAFGGINEVTRIRRMLYTAGDYDLTGSPTYDFQATARNSGGATTSITLKNHTDSSTLATVSTSNSTPTLLQSTGITPTTAKEYTTTLQRTTPGGTARIISAYLVIKLVDTTSLTKLLSPIQVFAGLSSGTSTVYSTNTNKACGWDVGDFDKATISTTYESSHLAGNPGFTGSAQTALLETSTINSGSENSTNQTTYQRMRNSYTASSGSNIDVDVKGKRTAGNRPNPYSISSGRILVFLTSITEGRRRWSIS